MSNKLETLVIILCIAAIAALSLWGGHYVGAKNTQIETLQMELAYAQRRIPNCQEDATLIGVGRFETTSGVPGGQWEAYECYLSFDDFLPAH